MFGTRGFMLVEVIVATLVLAVGVLALGATAAAVERMVGAGQRMGASAAVATSRFEVLWAGGCGALAGGGSADDRFAETWVVSGAGSLRTVSLTVSYSDGRGTRSDVYEAGRACR